MLTRGLRLLGVGALYVIGGGLGLLVMAAAAFGAVVLTMWAVQPPLDLVRLPVLLIWVPAGLVVMAFTGQGFRSDGP